MFTARVGEKLKKYYEKEAREYLKTTYIDLELHDQVIKVMQDYITSLLKVGVNLTDEVQAEKKQKYLERFFTLAAAKTDYERQIKAVIFEDLCATCFRKLVKRLQELPLTSNKIKSISIGDRYGRLNMLLLENEVAELKEENRRLKLQLEKYRQAESQKNYVDSTAQTISVHEQDFDLKVQHRKMTTKNLPPIDFELARLSVSLAREAIEQHLIDSEDSLDDMLEEEGESFVEVDSDGESATAEAEVQFPSSQSNKFAFFPSNGNSYPSGNDTDGSPSPLLEGFGLNSPGVPNLVGNNSNDPVSELDTMMENQLSSFCPPKSL